MKCFTIVVLLFTCLQVSATDFITRWDLSKAGSGSNQLSFGATRTGGAVTYTWQEVSPGTATGSGSWGTGTGTVTITGLPANAIIDLYIQPTNFKTIAINNGTDKSRLMQVSQWGTVGWSSMANAFYGCPDMQVTATDIPDLSGVTTMSQMFRNCTALTGPSNINSWNTSTITSMFRLFAGAAAFNQPIGNWNTASVTNMQDVFLNAASFNQPIGNWSTGNVTNMIGMFSGASSFNQPIDNWNTGNVTNMLSMFNSATAFNQSLDGWNTANVTNMEKVFYKATAFNQAVGSWSTGNVTNMVDMFNGATAFNQPIDSWNTSSVTKMDSMFAKAAAFNQPIGNWNTSNVTKMDSMFYRASSFNQPIGSWSTGNVTNMSSMFYYATAFNQPIGSWITTNVTNMRFMFFRTESFNQPIGSWNTGNVTDMESMFDRAFVFNQPIGNWNTSKVTNMKAMFHQASNFNQPIDDWDTGNVTDMEEMFRLSYFNQPIGSWNTANVKDMRHMFEINFRFNQPIGNWNTGNVTNMQNMFFEAWAFNQPIDNWNTSNVVFMDDMFSKATSFNQDIGSWTLHPTVVMSNMLDNSGMDYCNYSASLKGWAMNNPTITGRSLGAANMRYTSAVANAERALLVNSQSWTISGDAQVSFNPLLVPAGATIIPTPSCDDNVYIQPTNTLNKIMGVNANGNSFNYGTAAVTVTNAFATTLPSGTTTDASGFYEMNSGSNTMRVSRRLHTIQAPGSYTTNSGVIVRVYYDPAEITAITDNSTLPAGSSPLVQQGWFKSSKHSAQDVVNDMTPLTLSNAIQLTPTSTGNENGVEYAEFTLSSFSTIGYYATSNLVVLPVKLAYFTGASNGCAVILQWKSLTEENFSHYEIERSADGVSYSRINTRQGAGNAQGSRYQYADEQVADGNRYYYRLRMVDKDGKIAYSKVISLKIDCAGHGAFAILPNPAKDYATIKLPVAGGVLSLYAADGRKLLSMKVSRTIEVLPVMHLPKGMYLLRYLTPGGEMKATKLLKE